MISYNDAISSHHFRIICQPRILSAYTSSVDKKVHNKIDLRAAFMLCFYLTRSPSKPFGVGGKSAAIPSLLTYCSLNKKLVAQSTWLQKTPLKART
jgi:hypothetical protein